MRTIQQELHQILKCKMYKTLDMSNSFPVLLLLFICMFILSGCAEHVSDEKSGNGNEVERPNIIIIYADDVGHGDIGAYGSELIPTPHIDQLAADGIRFTSAYATAATCTPSRYSLLTGEYAFRIYQNRILK